MKRPQTAAAYGRHIDEFIKAMTAATYFVQDDIDDYFAVKFAANEANPPNKQESKSTKSHRKAALSLYLNDSLKLGIEFKAYPTKSNV